MLPPVKLKVKKGANWTGYLREDLEIIVFAKVSEELNEIYDGGLRIMWIYHDDQCSRMVSSAVD